MPDAQFSHPRLAAIYDAVDGDRSDLDHYIDIIQEPNARSILDIGCGTGSLACRLAALGFDVVGVDPALASLNVARAKPNADLVRWVHGTTTHLPSLSVDCAVMTGNVAQVFLDDEDWLSTLMDARSALRSGGGLIFETRDPARRGWEEWTPECTRSTVHVEDIGQVDFYAELLDVSLPFVTFRWTYHFGDEASTLTSDSVLRFREQDELRATLAQTGFSVRDVRDAPDRPGREFVFIAEAVG